MDHVADHHAAEEAHARTWLGVGVGVGGGLVVSHLAVGRGAEQHVLPIVSVAIVRV